MYQKKNYFLKSKMIQKMNNLYDNLKNYNLIRQNELKSQSIA